MGKEGIAIVVIAAAIILGGIFMAVKGKTTMIRERFSSGVSPQNERKFMMTIGGSIVVIGLDMLILGILPYVVKVTSETIITIMVVGVLAFVAVILVGQKYFRR